jgi:hypothetical protein
LVPNIERDFGGFRILNSAGILFEGEFLITLRVDISNKGKNIKGEDGGFYGD